MRSYQRSAVSNQLDFVGSASLRFAFFLLFVLVLAACSGDDEPEKPATAQPPTATAIPVTVQPTLSTELRLAAEGQYEQLRQLHVQMETIWDALLKGETAQCGEIYNVLSPEFVSADLVELRRAAIELENAVLLWQAECENPRSQPPPDVIDRGVLMVRAAGDALALVEQTLKE